MREISFVELHRQAIIVIYLLVFSYLNVIFLMHTFLHLLLTSLL